MNLKTICHIETPFTDKFGIPRQSGLVPEAIGILRFPNENFFRECLRGISEFSHLWLSFIFDKAVKEGEKSLVRPPRLGGKEKMGVWATRSPHRPNHLGLTVVKLLKMETNESELILYVGGVDLLNGTPIVDIKPYIPYADSISTATTAWVPDPENVFKPKVTWEKGLRQSLTEEQAVLIEKILEQDPRPSAQKDDKKTYVFNLFDFQIRFDNGAEEFKITSVI